MGKVIEIKTKQELEQVQAQVGVKVIDIYADWCAPCRFLAPKLEELAELYTDVSFFKVNSDTNLYPSIVGLPTIEIFRDNDLVKQIVGVDLAAVVAAIETALVSTTSPPQSQQPQQPQHPQKKTTSSYRTLNSYNKTNSL